MEFLSCVLESITRITLTSLNKKTLWGLFVLMDL